MLPNDTDVEGNPLTITSASIDTDGDGIADPLVLGTPTAITDLGGNPIGTLTVAANGDVTFDPAPNYTGPIPSLTYTPDGTAAAPRHRHLRPDHGRSTTRRLASTTPS